MKNPASFTKGASDLRKVAKLARAKGCLLARKFAPFVKIPGVKVEEHAVTGKIAKEEWNVVIGLLAEKELAEAVAVKIENAEDDKKVSADGGGTDDADAGAAEGEVKGDDPNDDGNEEGEDTNDREGDDDGETELDT